jgi:hypothetical protein
MTIHLAPLLAAALLFARAEAQSPMLPALPDFELPSASPRVYGLAGRVISVRRGESEFGPEREAEAALGENFPVLALRGGDHPIALGLGSQVYARFSLDDAKSALISHDWVVGLNATAALGRWDVTLQAFHESSHLGDEYGDRFPTSRVDWTRGIVATWVGYTTGPWRFAGNASYALLDGLGLPRAGAAAAIDYRGGPLVGILGGKVRPTLGIFAGADAATAWRVSTSVRAGIAMPAGSGREVGIGLIAHDGLSTQRQFYRRASRYLGMELRFDL